MATDTKPEFSISSDYTSRLPATSKQIETARNEYQSDDINIDDDALTSRAPDGVWVQAWVWVSNEEMRG